VSGVKLNAERPAGIEPVTPAWKAGILPIRRKPHTWTILEPIAPSVYLGKCDRLFDCTND
jgi:hypothetical protein